MKNIKLIERRNKIGLTQVEVAKKAGVSERAYQSYEAGKRQPNVQTADDGVSSLWANTPAGLCVIRQSFA